MLKKWQVYHEVPEGEWVEVEVLAERHIVDQSDFSVQFFNADGTVVAVLPTNVHALFRKVRTVSCGFVQ